MKVYRELADAQIQAIAMMMSVSNYNESRVSSSHSMVARPFTATTHVSHISDASALDVLNDSQDGGSDEEADEDLAFR